MTGREAIDYFKRLLIARGKFDNAASVICREEIPQAVAADGKVINRHRLEALYEFCAERGQLERFDFFYKEHVGDPAEAEANGLCPMCKGAGKVKCGECAGTGRCECCECGQEKDCDDCTDGKAECSRCGGTGKPRTKAKGVVT